MARRWLASLTAGLALLAAAAGHAQTIRFVPGVAAPTAFDQTRGRYVEGSSFDPYLCAEQPCGELLHNIFEGLVAVSDTGQITPALAVRWERLDDLRFRMLLRRGVKFQNGEVFDAESVRFSLMRASEAYGTTAWFPELERVDIIDPYTVDVVLKSPDSLFLYRLAHLALILPPKYFRQMGTKAFGEQPVGTGPFRFVRWDAARRQITLQANERYWRVGYPKVSRVVYRYVDSERGLEDLVAGKVDLLRRLNPRKTTQFMDTGSGKIVKAWLPQLVLGPFNLLKPRTPLKDVRVRKAINLAIDREDVLRYGAIGNGRLLGGYTVPEDLNHAALPPYPFDPDEARRLLKEAGYPTGFALSMLVSKEVPHQVDRIIAVSLAEVGIRVTIREASEADFLKELYLPKFGSGKPPSFDILLLSMPAGTLPHSGYVPMTLLYSGKPNESALKDPVLDQLYERALGTYHVRRAASLWKKLERYTYDNHLLLIGYHERTLFAAQWQLQFAPRTRTTFWDARYRAAP